MEIRIGDRFQFADTDWNDIIEVRQVTRNVAMFICLDPRNNPITHIGYQGTYDFEYLLSRDWMYLGNFNKSNNFTSLYNILNGD